MSPKNIPPIAVRLPKPLRDAIDKAATENQRSRNSEIVFRLSNSLGVRPGGTESK